MNIFHPPMQTNDVLRKQEQIYLVLWILEGGYKMSVLDNWSDWKNFLGDRLHQAQHEGMDGKVVSELAYQIGDYLSNQVEAKNDQEKVLADLWSVASPEEQHAIANMMVKLVNNNGTR
jgi:hypothetical protein